jgi:desulfoferrodoxin-like iron-binding protein
MPNEVGKRYVCAVCGAELLVTKAGSGALSCCAQPMQPKQPPSPR